MANPPYAEKLAGLVSPDTVVADKATGKIKKVDIAEKTINGETYDLFCLPNPTLKRQRLTAIFIVGYDQLRTAA
jgi:hypothetical protein